MQKFQEPILGRVKGVLAPIKGASIAVTSMATNLPAALYSDNGVTPLPQPLTTDENGYAPFYAADGKYLLTISGPRITTATREIILEDPEDNPYLTEQTLGLGNGANKVGFAQPGDGVPVRTLLEKLQEIISAKDYGVAADALKSDTADLLKAIEKTPAGGVLHLPPGRILANFPAGIARSNITIRGSGMPRVKADGTQLEGGTVICGTFWIYGDNLTLENFGVDRGSAVCASAYAGAAADALVVKHATSGMTLTNLNIHNVVGLCKSKDDAYHAVLIEGFTKSDFSNIRGQYGWYAVVFKGTESNARGVYAYESKMGGITIKSDSYAQCNYFTLKSGFIKSSTADGSALRVWSDTAQLEQVGISDVVTYGYSDGLKLETTGAQVLNNVQIDNVQCRNAALSVSVAGSSQDVSISNVDSNGPTSGYHLYLAPTVKGVRTKNIKGRSASFKADSMLLQGGFAADGIETFLNDMVTRNGIAVSNVIAKKWRLGNYTGSLNLNKAADGTAYTLPNGWTNYAAPDPARVLVKNNQVSMYGRINVPAAPWTGKEVCFVLPAELWPMSTREFMCQAFDNTGLRSYTVFVQVSATTGEVSILLLNQSGAFATTTAWVSLNGIVYDLEA